jgi:PAS domain S-box-containing protein
LHSTGSSIPLSTEELEIFSALLADQLRARGPTERALMFPLGHAIGLHEHETQRAMAHGLERGWIKVDGGRMCPGIPTPAAARQLGEPPPPSRARRKQQQRFHGIADLAPMGVAVLDAEARHVFVNAEWCRQTGKRLAEVVGRTPRQIWQTEESREATAQQIAAMRRDQGIPLTEYSHLQGLERRWYRWLLIPMRGAGAQPTGGVAFIWEITAEVLARSAP